jgi:hypothetical protein
MKNTSQYHYIIAACCTILGCSLFAYADWGTPTQNPPNGNIAPAVLTGTQYQIKSGVNASLTIQKGSTDISAPEGFSLYADAGVGVHSANYRALYPDWVFDGRFALDMNSPLYASGIFSTGNIAVLGSSSTPSMKVTDLKDASQPANSQAFVCGDVVQGELQPCNMVSPIPLSVSLETSVQSIPANTPTKISVSWESSGSICYPVSGLGFSTRDAAAGVDISNPITLQSGDSHQFSVACVNEAGDSLVKSAEVFSQASNDVVLTLNSAGTLYYTGEITSAPCDPNDINTPQWCDNITHPTNTEQITYTVANANSCSYQIVGLPGHYYMSQGAGNIFWGSAFSVNPNTVPAASGQHSLSVQVVGSAYTGMTLPAQPLEITCSNATSTRKISVDLVTRF